MRPSAGSVVDHQNGNGLDNRRENLRVCTQAENCLNSGKKRPYKRFKGVYRDRRNGSYYAQIFIKRIAFGSCGHATEESAAVAYDALAAKHHGEFARLNFEPPGAPVLGWL